jgi:hypothetical protein
VPSPELQTAGELDAEKTEQAAVRRSELPLSELRPDTSCADRSDACTIHAAALQPPCAIVELGIAASPLDSHTAKSDLKAIESSGAQEKLDESSPQMQPFFLRPALDGPATPVIARRWIDSSSSTARAVTASPASPASNRSDRTDAEIAEIIAG